MHMYSAPRLLFTTKNPATSTSSTALSWRHSSTCKYKTTYNSPLGKLDPMQSEFTVSPGAIPPRTSSSGLRPRRQRQSQSFTFANAFASSLPRLDLESSSAASASASGAVVEPLIELPSEAEWLDPRSRLGKRPEQMAKRPLHPQPPPRRSSKRVNHGELNSTTDNNGNGDNDNDMQHQINRSAPPDVARFAHDDFDFRSRGTWTADKEHIVRGPFEYTVSHPGKDFRSQIIAAFNAFLDVPPESLKAITSVVGMLHEASLLVDDVQDSSELRRGFPVAHNIFGVAQTINSANYIYFAALQELVKLGNQSVIQLFAEELLNLHRGQGMDLFWRDTLTCPTEDDYLEMVGNKTGGLFRLGIKLMQAQSTSDVDCVPLVNIIGLIFQIRDDYMNLSSSEYSHNKGMCEDLTEGKFSFPVIHSIRADPVDLQLINILKQKTTDVQVKRYAVSYMESKGSFDYTRQVVGTLIERARKMVAELDDESGRAAGIYKILDKMTISSSEGV